VSVNTCKARQCHNQETTDGIFTAVRTSDLAPTGIISDRSRWQWDKAFFHSGVERRQAIAQTVEQGHAIKLLLDEANPFQLSVNHSTTGCRPASELRPLRAAAIIFTSGTARFPVPVVPQLFLGRPITLIPFVYDGRFVLIFSCQPFFPYFLHFIGQL
jgi:hypothetical protein